MFINNHDSIITSKENFDVEEEMTLLELKLIEMIRKELININDEALSILDQTTLKIKSGVNNKKIKIGDLLREGKLNEKQKAVRSYISNMSKDQSKVIDLGYELIEDIVSDVTIKVKSPVGRPRKSQSNLMNKKITDYMNNNTMDLD
jgi:hypothetical protein